MWMGLKSTIPFFLSFKIRFWCSILGNRHLYEYCDCSEQCTGSTGANECKAIDGIKMCYCSDDRGIFEGACLKGNDG